MEQELPFEARLSITIAVEELEKDLFSAIAIPNADRAANAAKVFEQVKTWLWRSFMMIAAEWARIGLDSSEFARQMDRVQTVLLDKAIQDYELGCRLSGTAEPDPALSAIREDFRYILAVSGQGWCRRNNERLLMYTQGDGQTEPLYCESAAEILMRGGNPLVPDIPKPNSPDETPATGIRSLRAGSDVFDGQENAQPAVTGTEGNRESRCAPLRNTALAVKSDTTKQEGSQQRPGKEQKGDASLLAGKRAVSFRTAEQYLGITERHRQYLVRDGRLTVEGKGQNRKITTDSLRICLPPENPN